jgi:AcrR family transcriptional regulator
VTRRSGSTKAPSGADVGDAVGARRARPGTAVQAKGKQRAADILRAARAVLVEEGYAALTTRKIAQRAGIRLSNVQYYFPAKADLVRALFAASVAESARQVTGRPPAAKLSPARLMMWSVDQFLRSHHTLEQQVFLRELWAMSAHDPEVAAVMNRFYERWIDLVTRTLLAASPELGRARAQRRALVIISLVDGLSLFHGAMSVDHPAVHGIEAEVREVVQALLTRGLAGG